MATGQLDAGLHTQLQRRHKRRGVCPAGRRQRSGWEASSAPSTVAMPAALRGSCRMGSLDLNFGPFPIVTVGWFFAIALQPDGKPIIGGNFYRPRRTSGIPTSPDCSRRAQPQMSLDRTELRFGAVTNGAQLLSANLHADSCSCTQSRDWHGNVDGNVEPTLAAGRLPRRAAARRTFRSASSRPPACRLVEPLPLLSRCPLSARPLRLVRSTSP